MLHSAHCHGVGIIPGQPSDHKVNEVAPRQIHAQWAVCNVPRCLRSLSRWALYTQRGPGDQRPSDRKLDDKREHKLLHKYSRGTHREACIFYTPHPLIPIDQPHASVFLGFVSEGKILLLLLYLKKDEGIILLTSVVCVSFSVRAGLESARPGLE